MQRKEIEKNYIRKIDKLRKFDKAYFQDDKPLVSDREYDNIKEEFGVEVLRLDISDTVEDYMNYDGVVDVPPPMCPRDFSAQVGDTFYMPGKNYGENFDVENLYFSMFIGLFISIFGQFGDLLVSIYKRKQGFKDSGKIIPGHGGLLDRFDSLMLNMIFIFLLINLNFIS